MRKLLILVLVLEFAGIAGAQVNLACGKSKRFEISQNEGRRSYCFKDGTIVRAKSEGDSDTIKIINRFDPVRLLRDEWNQCPMNKHFFRIATQDGDTGYVNSKAIPLIVAKHMLPDEKVETLILANISMDGNKWTTKLITKNNESVYENTIEGYPICGDCCATKKDAWLTVIRMNNKVLLELGREYSPCCESTYHNLLVWGQGGFRDLLYFESISCKGSQRTKVLNCGEEPNILELFQTVRGEDIEGGESQTKGLIEIP